MNIISCAISMDGYIADRDGGVGWLDAFQNSEYGFREFYKSIELVVMGSKTYEQILTFGQWPYSGKKVYVVSNRNLQIDIPNTFLLQENIIEQLKKMGRTQKVWLAGGCEFYSTCIKNNLVDEMVLTTIPVMVGTGIPLVNVEIKPTAFTLINTKTFSDGVSERHYQLKSETEK